MLPRFLLSFAIALPAVTAISNFIDASSYIAEWIQVNYTTEGGWDPSTLVSQQEIVAAADQLAAQGPWAVTNKTIISPTGDLHDYLSWVPYWWPDCSNVDNSTELSQLQIWTECRYIQRDGQFNPDRSLVNDTGAFAVLSNAVFYNVLAYRITEDNKYAANAAHFIDTWFVNPETNMNPNLDYAQVIRGVGQPKTGAHTGVLDLHCATKIISGILVMRAMGAPAWTSALDEGMNAWSRKYLNWLLTSPIALEEKAAKNNHGSFYFAQTASFQILIGDLVDARDMLQQYFDGIFKDQITATGEQPYEADRTRATHYRAYNAGAMITMHRMSDYLGWDTWGWKSTAGATSRDAVDFSLSIPPDKEGVSEQIPNVAAIASHFGDPTGKYAKFLKDHNAVYPGEAWFFWNQPLTNSGIEVHLDESGSIKPGPSTNSSSSTGGKTGVIQTQDSGASTISFSLRTGLAAVASVGIGLSILL